VYQNAPLKKANCSDEKKRLLYSFYKERILISQQTKALSQE
jgi:hypothetical protein